MEELGYSEAASKDLLEYYARDLRPIYPCSISIR